MKIIHEMMEKMTGISVPQKKFMEKLFSNLLSFRGKANFLNLSRYAGCSEKTIRRNYRKSFDFEKLNLMTAQKSLSSKCILSGDATFIKKSGKHTFGLGKFFHSTTGRPEKGLEVSLLALTDSDKRTMALSACQTPPSAKDEETRVDFYLKHLQESKPFWPDEIKYGVFDGFYSKSKFVDGVRETGLHMIGKLRKDADMKYLYDGTQKHFGRQRKFTGKVIWKNLSNFDYIGELEPDIHCYTKILWHISLKRILRCVVLLNTKDSKKPTHVIFFSTDLSLTSQSIINFYSSRFQIEFLFRDAKQFVGLEDCQARDQAALHFHFNACFSALNLAKYDALKSHVKPGQFVFSMATQKCRFFNEHLLERFISKLDLEPTWIKRHPAYQELRIYGAIAA